MRNLEGIEGVEKGSEEWMMFMFGSYWNHIGTIGPVMCGPRLGHESCDVMLGLCLVYVWRIINHIWDMCEGCLGWVMCGRRLRYIWNMNEHASRY